MPIARFEMPDGRIGRFEVPDGTTPEQAKAMIAQSFKPKEEAVDPFKEAAQGQSNVLAGIGGALQGMYLGGKQMLGIDAPGEVEDHKKAMAGLGSTTSGTIGQFLGSALPVAATAFLPGVNTVVGGAALGGLTGALEPTSGNESRLQNVALGAGLGGAGQGLASAIGRMNKPVRASLDPISADLAAKAQKMGITLNAAQETGSKPLRWIDSALDNLPLTAEKQVLEKTKQREAWQRAVLAKTGEQGDNATPDVMAKAYDRIGQQFNDLSARNTVTLDGKAQMEISRIKAKNAKAGPLGSSKVNEVTQWLDDLTKPTGSPILGPNGKPLPIPAQPLSGQQYQEARSVLSKSSQDAFSSGNSQLGQSLKDLRNTLDEAANRSIKPDDAKAWAEARDQWKAIKSIEKATDPTTGTISPKKLVNELTRKNPQGMIYGKGDQSMPDIAKVGKKYIADNLPDSGTAQRSWWMNALQNPTAGVGGLLGFAGGGPLGALAGIGMGAATPLAAQKALWSQGGKDFFKNGLVQMSPENLRLLRAANSGATAGLLSLSE